MGKKASHTLLPTSSPPSPTLLANNKLPHRTLRLPKRYTRLFLALLVACFILYSLCPQEDLTFPTEDLYGYPPFPMTLDSPPEGFPTYENSDEPKPPLYERYTQWEEETSQIVHPHLGGGLANEGEKYLFLANHQRFAGWGNAMQEMLLNVYLAWESGRGFVFDNYTWDMDGPSYSDWNGRLRPSRIPLSTMLAGPIVGFPFQNSSEFDIPRSISKNRFYEICSPDEIEVIDSDEVRKMLPVEVTAMETLRAWVDRLKDMGRCVEVKRDSPQLFDIWIMGSPRVHDIWPTIASSPIMREFKWSPLIHRMFLKNFGHFTSLPPMEPTRSASWFDWHQQSPPNTQHDLAKSHTQQFLARESQYLSFLSEIDQEARTTYGPTQIPSPSSPLPIIALHLRRGDFQDHCNHLSEWGSTYTGFNTLPGLPDHFAVSEYENGSEDYKKAYQRHCWPSTEDIVRTVRTAVIDWVQMRKREEAKGTWWRSFSLSHTADRKLRKVYIMTNGDLSWLAEIKRALEEDASRSGASSEEWQGVTWEWDDIGSSRSLNVGWEEKHVSQALDMYVGQRAEVFVGNGFSSLTANIALLRLANGMDANMTRFW